MIHSIELGGKERRVLFGNYVFRRIKEELGIKLSDVSEAMTSQDITIIPTLLFYALKAADVYDGVEVGSYNLDQVCVWMDTKPGTTATVLPWITEAISDACGAPAPGAEDDDAKKKN